MSNPYLIHKADRKIVGEITLAGSKSISNRALIIRALSKDQFQVDRLANAKDTKLLIKLLGSNTEVRDAGAAGTTFRFMTAYLSTKEGSQVLTGTERMKQRPIGVLAEALKKLGAKIEYIEKPGYPPLRIGSPEKFGQEKELFIAANTSSQYISALLMLAPTLPNGLELHLEGGIVSRSYIEMTLNLIQYFGVQYHWEGNTIKIEPQEYKGNDFVVEADWSAASYYYALAAFADELDLQLNGLFEESVQGDSALVEIMEHFGVKSTFNKNGVHLSKIEGHQLPEIFEWDFILCPDIAQTLAVVCAGLGVKGRFTGLSTLRIKETDRIMALEVELAKVGVKVYEDPTAEGFFIVEGIASLSQEPTFDTYEDHRMAMAFAPFGMLGQIRMNEPMVVVKSYPDFYKDYEKIGFEVKK
jgi:3-phosphoshikimate 1-carboxyvinyltransferase